MVLHQPFFDVLSAEQIGSAEWSAALAGLVVLRLVDSARADSSVIDADWTGLRAATDSVNAMREGTPLRRRLTRIMDELRNPDGTLASVNDHIFAYGRALDTDGHWQLAADVFATVAEIARAEKTPEVAMEATIALGGTARRCGDWELSASGYAEAAHFADALDDKASGLTVRVGTANTQIARGNIPAAQSILDEVIDAATASGFDGVLAIALHSRATASHLRGNYHEAVKLGYEALEKTTNPNQKDAVMADVAAALAELGILNAARDAHMIISLTSRYQWVRWQATINLMELASMEGMEGPFEEYARELRNAALDPKLRSYFLLYYGQGLVSFGRDEEGRKYICEALEFASKSKINQVASEAEQALKLAATKRPAEPKKAWVESVPDDLVYVTAGLAQLRESAALAAPTPEWT
ncbi:MAG TPA: hypothetical protein VM166_05445 [Gemmatimonadaceae bacterium]|nr:hypothetical protein [Gemmatimonadaceae bacterium]